MKATQVPRRKPKTTLTTAKFETRIMIENSADGIQGLCYKLIKLIKITAELAKCEMDLVALQKIHWKDFGEIRKEK